MQSCWERPFLNWWGIVAGVLALLQWGETAPPGVDALWSGAFPFPLYRFTGRLGADEEIDFMR